MAMEIAVEAVVVVATVVVGVVVSSAAINAEAWCLVKLAKDLKNVAR